MTEPTDTRKQSPGIATISPATWLWWVRRQARSSLGRETGSQASTDTGRSRTSGRRSDS